MNLLIDINMLNLCFEDAGIFADINNNISENDIDIRDFINSSLQFISIIVSIEEKFNIEFPDEYLIIDTFSSVKNLISIIESLQES